MTRADARTREGNRGTTLHPAWPAHTPKHRLFGQATPGPAPTLEPAPASRPCSHLGLLLLGAEPAGAQPGSRWSPARAREAGTGRNDLDAGEHRPTIPAQEQAEHEADLTQRGLDLVGGSEFDELRCRRA